MKTLHVGRPNMAAQFSLLEAFESVLASQWLTNDGPWVRRLEGEICDELGVGYCVAVANGTLGLEIAARALMPELGEVIMPSFTFVATAHALAWQGYKPVFADINPKTHVLDPQDVEAKITERTVGILGVHLWGTPCAPLALSEVAERYQLKLFFDAAHAFRCQGIGSLGECEVFSFHATKFFNTVEGGAVTTNDKVLAQKLRELRNFGFRGDGTHKVSGLGINAKMSELHAAVGVTNLAQIDKFIQWNFGNYLCYRRRLIHPDIRVYELPGLGNFQYIVIEIAGGADALAKALQAEDVLARRYFSPPCHAMPPYDQEGDALPVTEAVAERVLVLPTGMAVTQQDVSEVCRLILRRLAGE